LRTCYPCT